jgi:hypothetical protein
LINEHISKKVWSLTNEVMNAREMPMINQFNTHKTYNSYTLSAHSTRSYSIFGQVGGHCKCKCAHHSCSRIYPQFPRVRRMPIWLISASTSAICHHSSPFSSWVELVGHKRSTMNWSGRDRPFPSDQALLPKKGWNYWINFLLSFCVKLWRMI